MVLIFWYINWFGPGIRAHYAFFPLWLGYILVVNGLVYIRKGNSLIDRSWLQWLFLFVISSPVWWLFEWMNQKTGYWEYTSLESFNRLEYVLYCSLNFSVVIPAIFAAAEWIGTFHFIEYFQNLTKVLTTSFSRGIFFVFGWIMLGIVLLVPAYGLAFMWMALFFIMDPINYWLGYKSIISETMTGNWKTVAGLWIGALITGFFWEMWNFYSDPKWIYHIPYVNFMYLFEMPALGYLGYLPFALELYSIYYFLVGVLKLKTDLQI